MKYEYIHRITNSFSKDERAILDKAVILANSNNNTSGLDTIAAFLQKATNIDYVMIGQALNPNTIQTTAFWGHGQKQSNITYNITNTPCSNTLQQNVCYYPYNIQQLFPKDEELKLLNIDSYLGTSICTDTGEAIGVVALLHHKTIQEPAFIETLTTILLPRLEMELQELHGNNKKYQLV